MLIHLINCLETVPSKFLGGLSAENCYTANNAYGAVGDLNPETRNFIEIYIIKLIPKNENCLYPSSVKKNKLLF